MLQDKNLNSKILYMVLANYQYLLVGSGNLLKTGLVLLSLESCRSKENCRM